LLRVLGIVAPALFTLASAWGLGRWLWRRRPPSETLAVASGAVVLSLLVYLTLLAGVTGRRSFAVIGMLCCSGLAGIRRPRLAIPHWTGWLMAAFGAYYAVHALAPEIQPDGVTYHLGLVKEWLSLRRFPSRIGFYELLPQGLEMLFGFAFAFGRHSAAKLAHFGFLVLTVPLILATGRRFQLAAGPAALLYFASPVVAITGTSAYSDAAFVFFAAAAFLLLVIWKDEPRTELLFHAGLASGFCYAIKIPGLVVLPFAVGWLLWRKEWRGSAWFLAGSLMSILPWMLRALWLTGNPFAPLLNNVFPNDYFHYGPEKYLSEYLRSYGGITWARIPWELLGRGGTLQGLIGPAFLLAPLALLSLRRAAGRWLLAAALVVSLPWWLNHGTRFLMPAIPFVALAIPAPVAAPMAVAHAVLSLPPVLDRYTPPASWRLKGFPWRAAFRLEPEEDYLRKNLWEYRLAEMVSRHVKPGDTVLDLFAIPSAYTPVVPAGPLSSAQFDGMADALAVAATDDPQPLYQLRATLPQSEVARIRFELEKPTGGPWGIHEVQFFSHGVAVPAQTTWELEGKPNRGDTPRAFDRNPATRWQTWMATRGGEFLEVSCPSGLRADEVAVTLSKSDHAGAVARVQGKDTAWTVLESRRAPVDTPLLRRQAVLALRGAGVRWIVVSSSGEGHGVIGLAMMQAREAWGVEAVEETEGVYLFRIP